jgi:hypothetical protein
MFVWFPDLFFFKKKKLLLSKFENDAKASFIIYFCLELHLPSGGAYRIWTRSVGGRGGCESRPLVVWFRIVRKLRYTGFVRDSKGKELISCGYARY